jgi:pimeloyl-ACP methyl ester carboxylesterase
VRVEVNGARIFVDIDGAEYLPDGPEMKRRPTLILLHGGPGLDHSSFKGELGHLREEMQIVYVDHRGNGRSDRATPETWNLEQWADDVHALCETLGIERPIVMGQSFGGFVAQMYAARHPEQPGGLIFSSTSPRFVEERNLAVFERLGGPEVRQSAENFYADPCGDTLVPFIAECMPHYNTRFSDPDGMSRSVVNMDVLLHFFANEYPGADLAPGLANIRCPTLVLGGEDDPTTPIGDQVDIAAAVPAEWVEFHRFPDCGHGTYRDCPDEAIPILRKFIRRAYKG